MNLNLTYKGKVDEHFLFTYKVDGEEEMTRVKPINDGKNYELNIGFGENRCKLIIDARSRMGRCVTKQISTDVS